MQYIELSKKWIHWRFGSSRAYACGSIRWKCEIAGNRRIKVRGFSKTFISSIIVIAMIPLVFGVFLTCLLTRRTCIRPYQQGYGKDQKLSVSTYHRKSKVLLLDFEEPGVNINADIFGNTYMSASRINVSGSSQMVLFFRLTMLSSMTMTRLFKSCLVVCIVEVTKTSTLQFQFVTAIFMCLAVNFLMIKKVVVQFEWWGITYC